MTQVELECLPLTLEVMENPKTKGIIMEMEANIGKVIRSSCKLRQAEIVESAERVAVK